jgi:hypothetical protein
MSYSDKLIKLTPESAQNRHSPGELFAKMPGLSAKEQNEKQYKDR